MTNLSPRPVQTDTLEALEALKPLTSLPTLLLSPPPTRDIVSVYNRYLVELIVLLKSHGGSAASRAIIAARHRAVDASSDSYIRHAIRRDMPTAVLHAGDVLDASTDLVRTDVMLQGLPLATLSAECANSRLVLPDDCVDAPRARALIHILATLAAAHAPEEPALEKQTLAVLGRLQNPVTEVDRTGELLDAVLDDGMRRHLELVRAHLDTAAVDSTAQQDSTDSAGEAEQDDIAKMLEASKLGSLAREMLSDIGPDALESLAKDPPTSFDFAQISDASSPIGSLVQKAGSKLVSKLSSGELNKEELIADLVKMMSAFGSGKGKGGGADMPTGMSEMMTSMSGMLQGMQQQHPTGHVRHTRARK